MNQEEFYRQAQALINGELPPAERSVFEDLLSREEALAEDFRLFQIEQYLAGTLPENYLVLFEKKIGQEPELAKEVQWHKGLQEQIQTSRESELKAELRSIFPPSTEEELEAVEVKPLSFIATRRRILLLAGVAASLLLLVFALDLFYQPSQSPDELFAAYFEPYPMKIGARGDASADNRALQNAAIAAYQNRDYRQAAKHFGRLSNLEPENPQMQLYAGISLLANQNISQAISVFQTLEEDFHYREQAQWYLALAYLKNEQSEEAGKQLVRIRAEPEHFYYRLSKELSEKMGL